MKTKPTKKGPTFGHLIENFYEAYGERKGQGILRLLIKAELVGFRGRSRFVLDKGNGKV